MERDRQPPNLFSKFLKKLKIGSKPDILVGASKKLNRKYESLNQILGEGSYATTSLWRDRSTGISYACKSIPKEKIESGQLPPDYVRREVNILKSLPSHHNIVCLQEVFEDHKEIHLLMELCEGGELFERIRYGRFYQETEAKKLIKSMIHVVQWCHIHGVIHRDIKPENFVFGSNDNLKAIDFGFAILFNPGQRFSEIYGSLPYMAPEIFQGNYGPEIDVWSAGVVAYFKLCGRQPFRAADNAAVKEKILRAEIDFRRAPWPMVSDEAKALVKGMLERNVEKRLTPRQIVAHPWLSDSAGATNSRSVRPMEEGGYSNRGSFGR